MIFQEFQGRTIMADEEKCNGCLRCQLYCSLRFEKVFNISKSAIVINRFSGRGTDHFVSFTDKCDACGICAKHCPYNALFWEKRGTKERT